METERLRKDFWRKSPQWFALNRRHAEARARSSGATFAASRGPTLELIQITNQPKSRGKLELMSDGVLARETM